MTATIHPVEAATRLTDVANRLATAGIDAVHALDVSAWSVLVHLRDEAAVDRAAEQFEDTEPDAGDGATYTRVGFFDGVVTVRLFADRDEPSDAELAVAWNAPDAHEAHKAAWHIHQETRS